MIEGSNKRQRTEGHHTDEDDGACAKRMSVQGELRTVLFDHGEHSMAVEPAANNAVQDTVGGAAAATPAAAHTKNAAPYPAPITILMALSMTDKDGWEALPRRERRERKSTMEIGD